MQKKIRLVDPTLSDTDDDDDVGENEKKQEDNYQNFQELHYPSSDSADDISIQDTDAEEDFRPPENLIKGDFVLVQLKGLKNVHHYIAQIDDPSTNDSDPQITYLERKIMKQNKVEAERFFVPENANSYPVPRMDIFKKTAKANNHKGYKADKQAANFFVIIFRL